MIKIIRKIIDNGETHGHCFLSVAKVQVGLQIREVVSYAPKKELRDADDATQKRTEILVEDVNNAQFMPRE